MTAKSLLLPKPRGKKKHSKTSWSSLLSFRTAWSFSPLQNHMDLYLLASESRGSLLPSELHGLLPIYFGAAWSPPSSPKPPGPLSFPPEPHGPLSLWLLCLGLNPSARLPLQPHFQLLLQSVIPASIPVFFQLYWAAILSLGRCGPMAWSQSSPSSHAGPVTRGSYFPVPSWVEFGPIPLAQSMATAT